MGEPATARLTEPDISVYNKSRSEQWPITIVLVNGQSITGPVSRFGRYTVAVRVGDVIRMVYKTSIAYIEFSTEVNFRGYGFVTEATVLEQAAI
jgi:RNA chaperone Hfq